MPHCPGLTELVQFTLQSTPAFVLSPETVAAISADVPVCNDPGGNGAEKEIETDAPGFTVTLVLTVWVVSAAATAVIVTTRVLVTVGAV